MLATLRKDLSRWWVGLPLATQLTVLILAAGFVSAVAAQALATFALSTPIAGVHLSLMLCSVLTVVLVVSRLVTRGLHQLIEGAQSLVAGEYHGVERRAGASAEARKLEDAFAVLAESVAEREALMHSELLQMREVERLKDEFIATVSHELRTPLTSVRGALGLVLGGALGAELSPKARDLLRIALQNSERLIRLINDILDVEKMEAGQMSMNEQRCDLDTILATTVSGVQAVAHDAGVRLVVEGDTTVAVTGDADRLVQVFTNLASNAIRFSPRGEEVRLRVDAGGAQVSVHVIDHGPGIAPEFRDRIFGKFQQGEGAMVRRPGGTGLGLAIARAITESHGGTIRFDSTIGAGTTFSVDLPCLAAPRPIARTDCSGLRILLVERDDSMRNILETLCTPIADVTGVRSAQEALSASRGPAFDAIIIDPALPDMEGFSLVRRLRESPACASAPVLVYATREYTSEELEGVTLSPSHAFVKSRDRESDLVLRLRAVLTARRHGPIRAAA